MDSVEYLNNFDIDKIIWDMKINKQHPRSKDINDTVMYTLDTENTNENNNRCITYATQLMEFGRRTKQDGGIEFIEPTERMMYLFTHPVKFWEYIHNTTPQKIELYVFNAEYDVNNLLNFAIKKYNLQEQQYTIEEVEEYEGMFKDNTKRLSFKDTYTYKKMNRNGKIYRCDIQLDTCQSGKTKGVKRITIIDMAKKLTGSLKVNVESFTPLKMNKADLDYTIFRDYGHVEYTEQELLYMWNDVYCLADLTKEYVYSGKYKHTDKLTTSSMALANFKDELLEDFKSSLSNPYHILYDVANEFMTYCKKIKIIYMLANYDTPKYKKLCDKYYAYKELYPDYETRFILEEYVKVNEVFDFIFPKLTFKSFDYVRTSYCGGITRFKDKNDVGNWINEKGIGVDINSSFPYSYTIFKLPYGEGILKTNVDYVPMEDDKVYITRLRVHNFKVRKNKEPNISKVMMETVSNIRNIETWVKEFKGECVLTLTSVDYEYFINNYDYEYMEILDYMEYKAKIGFFNAFTNKFYGIKSQKNVSKGIRSWVKLILNGVYGKLGQNKCSELRRDNYNESTNSIDDIIVYENDITVEILSEGVYIPLASFVTAYSRIHLITVLNIINVTKGIEWKYCDTDSAYVVGNVDILKSAIKDYIDLEYTGELGKWKIEKYFSRLLIIGIKKYIYYGGEYEDTDYKYHCTLSGINGKYFDFIADYCNIDDKCITEIDKDGIEFIQDVNMNGRKYFVGEDNNPFIYRDEKLSDMVYGAYRSIRKKTVQDGQILYNTIYCIKGGNKQSGNN